MLSVNNISAKITSGGKSMSYIDYLKDQIEKIQDYNAELEGLNPGLKAQELMRWVGSNEALFKELGIDPKAPLDFEKVKSLLLGLDPRDGKTVLVGDANNGQDSKCIGVELNFSWDKTESLVELMMTPEQQNELRREHNLILDEIIKETESHFFARTSENGQRSHEKILGVVGQIYEHSDARPVDGEIGDYQKHWHGNIPNIGFYRGESGELKTKSLDAHQVFAMQKNIGALYRSKKAEMWQRLGYEGERYSIEHGIENPEQAMNLWRLKGIDEKMVKAFSNRRYKEILPAALEKGVDTQDPKAMDRISTNTRSQKDILVPHADAVKHWHKKAGGVGLTPELVRELKALNPTAPEKTLGELKFEKQLSGASSKTAYDGLLKNKEQLIVEYDKATLLNQITNLESRFSEKDFELVALTYFCGSKVKTEEAKGMFKKWVNETNSDLVPLPNGIYSTVAMIRAEANLLKLAEAGVNKNGAWRLNEKQANEAILKFQAEKGFNLTIEQQNAMIKSTTTASQISLILGKAGAGKTTEMEAVKELYESIGFKVRGIAPSNKAASGLKEGAGLEDGRSVDSLLHQIQTGKVRLTEKDVIILDEVGMCGVVNVEKLVSQLNGAKLIMCGDDQQLKPVAAGSAFHELIQMPALVSEIHVLKEVRRQKNPFALDVSLMLSEAQIEPEQVKTLVERMEREGWVKGSDTDNDAKQELVSSVLKLKVAWREKPILAFSNADVGLFNRSIQSARAKNGELKESGRVEVRTKNGLEDQNLFVGDRFIFNAQLKNGLDILAQKSEVGEVISMTKSGKGFEVQVRLDSGKIAKFDSEKFQKFGLGYATTVHKAQGITATEPNWYYSGKESKDLCYVALSRMKDKVNVFCEKDKIANLTDLKVIEHKGFVLHDLTQEQKDKILGVKPASLTIEENQNEFTNRTRSLGEGSERTELQQRIIAARRAQGGLQHLHEQHLNEPNRFREQRSAFTNLLQNRDDHHISGDQAIALRSVASAGSESIEVKKTIEQKAPPQMNPPKAREAQSDVLLKTPPQFNTTKSFKEEVQRRLALQPEREKSWVEEQLERGEIDVRSKGQNDVNWLHSFITDGNPESDFDAVIKAGIDLNARDSKGRTPLHYATEKGDEKIVRKLLLAGANPGIMDHSSTLASEIANYGLKSVLERAEQAFKRGELITDKTLNPQAQTAKPIGELKTKNNAGGADRTLEDTIKYGNEITLEQMKVEKNIDKEKTKELGRNYMVEGMQAAMEAALKNAEREARGEPEPIVKTAEIKPKERSRGYER